MPQVLCHGGCRVVLKSVNRQCHWVLCGGGCRVVLTSVTRQYHRFYVVEDVGWF